MGWRHKYVHVTVDGGANLAQIDSKLDLILTKLGIIQQREDQQMADLSAIQAEVQENTDAVASASALLTQLSAELRAAATDPAAIQALADQLDANNAALSQAVVDNTPTPSA